MSRNFDGSTGFLSWTQVAALRPVLPVTVAAWINPDTITAGDGIFTTNKVSATNRGLWFQITNGTGNLEASYGDNTGTTASDRRSKVSTGAVTTGSWQHVACCIRGAGDMDIYIAGSDAGGSYSGSGGTLTHSASFGGMVAEVVSNTFDGRLAEVGLWTVSLSAAEILALAKGVPPAKIRPDVLLGYWPVYGAADPEINLGTTPSKQATLNGTAPLADHAPVGAPFPVAA